MKKTVFFLLSFVNIMKKERRALYLLFVLFFILSFFPIIQGKQRNLRAYTNEQSYETALNYYLKGDFKSSQAILEKLLVNNWNNYDIILLAAHVCWKTNKITWSLANFDKAIQIKPKIIDAYLSKNQVLMETGNLNEALKSAKNTTVLFSNDYQSWNQLAQVLLKRKDFPEVIRAAEKAISLKSDNFRAFNLIGLAHLSDSKIDLAYIAFKTALSYAPSNSFILNNLGVVMERKNNFTEAKEYYLDSLKINPDHPTAKLNLERLKRKIDG